MKTRLVSVANKSMHEIANTVKVLLKIQPDFNRISSLPNQHHYALPDSIQLPCLAALFTSM